MNKDSRGIRQYVFDNVTAQLSEVDMKIIENYGLKETYRKHVGSFENIKLLKSFIEKDVFQIIFEELLKRDKLARVLH